MISYTFVIQVHKHHCSISSCRKTICSLVFRTFNFNLLVIRIKHLVTIIFHVQLSSPHPALICLTISFPSFVKHFSSFIKQISQMSGTCFPNEFKTFVTQIHKPHVLISFCRKTKKKKNMHFVKSIYFSGHSISTFGHSNYTFGHDYPSMSI